MPDFSVLAVGFAGCATAALCWVLMTHVSRLAARALAKKVADVDVFDTAAQRATMPLAWRLGWPMIAWAASLFSRLARPSQRPTRPIALDRAGLPAGITGTHIGVARVLAGTVAAMALMLLQWALRHLLPGAFTGVPIVVAGMVAGACLPGLWLGARTRRRKLLIERELPFFLDLLALCVQGGLSIQGAMHEAVRYGPQGVLRDEVAHVLAELRAGQSRVQAFEGLSRRSGSRAVRASVGAILQAEALGISLGNQLKEQARAQGTARFEHAERQALKAPVKLLMPLMVFIFPCTFIVIGFPIVMSMRQALA